MRRVASAVLHVATAVVIALPVSSTLTGCGHHYDNLVAPPVDNGGGGCTTNCNPPPHDSTGGGNTYTGSTVILSGPDENGWGTGDFYISGTTCNTPISVSDMHVFPGGLYSTWDSTRMAGECTKVQHDGFTFVRVRVPPNTAMRGFNFPIVKGSGTTITCWGYQDEHSSYFRDGKYWIDWSQHTRQDNNPPPPGDTFTFPFTNTLTPNASTTMSAHNPIVGGLKDGVTTVWIWSKMDKDWIWWVTGSAPTNFSASTAAPCMGNLLNGVTADPMGIATNQPDVYEYKLPTWLRGVIVRTNEPVRWKTDPTGDALGFAYIQQSIHTVGGGSNGYRWYIAPDGKPLPASMAPAGTPMIDPKNGLFAAVVLRMTIN